MSADRLQALVNNYFREGYIRQVQTVCNEVLRSRVNDPVALLWRAFSLALEGSYSEVDSPFICDFTYYELILSLLPSTTYTLSSSVYFRFRPCGSSRHCRLHRKWD